MSPVSTAPARLTASAANLRAQYLREVLSVLYPPPCAVGDGHAEMADPVTEYLVVPDARRPRLLVPARSRKLAMAAVRRYAEPQSRLARLKRDAVVTALRTGASSVLLRDRVRVACPEAERGEGTIDGYLRGALGADLAVSIHIGPARANRKPVLQLLTPTGQTIAFAKLGTGPLTRRLVRAEAAALTALAHVGLRRVSIPRVLHSGGWRGHQVLVQSALPVWRPRSALPAATLAEAMVEVALSCGTATSWLATSSYWAELRGRLRELTNQDEGAELCAAAETLVERAGELPVRFGAWHGDWAPWNMAALADTLLVWDWERFAVEVPLGFDAVHHELQRRIQSDTDAGAAVEETLRRADDLLAPFEVPPAAREITALLYLVDLAARYLGDRQAEAGARLGVLGTWLLPVLVRRVAAIAERKGSER